MQSNAVGRLFPPDPLLIHDLVAQQVAASAYVAALQRYGHESRAASHPLLAALAVGDFRQPRAAMQRFFSEYYFYSRIFTRFLALVTAALDRPEHRALLVPNSAEESGHLDPHHQQELRAAGLDPADVASPHSLLFRRFLVAAGIQIGEIDTAAPQVATRAWIHAFESLCRSQEAIAVGALGIATEGIVRGMYTQLLAGIRLAWPDMSARDRAFFELHALVDDDHADTLRSIAVELAADNRARPLLAVGVLGALEARASFYDHMLAVLRAGDAGEDGCS